MACLFMTVCKNICKPESFCSGIESILVVEIGMSAKSKVKQVKEQTELLSPYTNVNSGVIYFKNRKYLSYNPPNNTLSFCAQYKFIPEDLILDRYLDTIRNAKIWGANIKIPSIIEKCVVEKNSEQLYNLIKTFDEGKYSHCYGKLCELIAMEDLKRIDIGKVFLNMKFHKVINNKNKSKEVDVLVAGRKKMYDEFMNKLKSKEHLRVVEF